MYLRHKIKISKFIIHFYIKNIYRKAKEEAKRPKKMSMDSKDSKDIIEENNSSMLIEEESQSQEINNNFVKNSRIAKANKDIETMEAMENSDKVK